MDASGSSNLANKRCVPCEGGVPALTGTALEQIAKQVPQWRVIGEHHLLRSFSFPDFKESLEFVNRVGETAEREGHHPDICFGWGSAEVTIFTHKIKGLSESDFILAAKIDQLL